MDQSLVSVIIPTYNRAALLKEAINSCHAQLYRPIECIVVDDGSSDNTSEVVEQLQRQYNTNDFFLRYMRQQNAGSQVARNTGTTAATGEFIQYLDSDDLLYPQKLQQQLAFLKTHAACDAVFSDWEKGTPDYKEKIIAYKSGDLITQFLVEKCIANFSMLMRRKLTDKIGEWDINIKRNQEIDYHLRAVLAGAEFEYLPGFCGLWRTHNNDRIVTSTGLKAVLTFYQKWENILTAAGRFTNEMAKKIAAVYMWLLSTNKNAAVKDVRMVLKEVIRLDPGISFYQNKKLRLLSALLGKNIALAIWWKRFCTVNKNDKK